MAKPIKFEEATSICAGPYDVGNIPIYDGPDRLKVSYWKLSLRERISALFIGGIILSVWADVHPAVDVEAFNPWE